MTKKEKELLLKDLSARLLYGVKCRGTFCKKDTRCKGGVKICDKDFIFDGIVFSEDNVFELDSDTVIDVSSVKIYLRPMSDMSEEEKEEFENILEGIVDGIERWDKPDLCEEYDWLNKHMFDYRGLIEKRLALKAPEGMYNVKNK